MPDVVDTADVAPIPYPLVMTRQTVAQMSMV
jgi:hypothetical protein